MLLRLFSVGECNAVQRDRGTTPLLDEHIAIGKNYQLGSATVPDDQLGEGPTGAVASRQSEHDRRSGPTDDEPLEMNDAEWVLVEANGYLAGRWDISPAVWNPGSPGLPTSCQASGGARPGFG